MTYPFPLPRTFNCQIQIDLPYMSYALFYMCVVFGNKNVKQFNVLPTKSSLCLWLNGTSYAKITGLLWSSEGCPEILEHLSGPWP